MPLPNEYDIFAFILRVSGFIFIIASIIVPIVSRGFKKHKKIIIILVILGVVAFLGANRVMEAKPVYFCPPDFPECNNF